MGRASIFLKKVSSAPVLMMGMCCLLILPSCGYKESKGAHEGLSTVVGMTDEDLQACMGIPDKSLMLSPHTKLFEYMRTIRVPSANDSGIFPLQTAINLAENTLGGAGATCIATVRMVDNRVTDMHYSGDNDHFVGTNGVCYAIVRGCLETPVKSGRKRASTLSFFNPVTSYRSQVEEEKKSERQFEKDKAKERQIEMKEHEQAPQSLPNSPISMPAQKNIDVDPQKSNLQSKDM